MSLILLIKNFNKIISLIFFLVIVILISPKPVFSQTAETHNDKVPDRTFHHEVKDDDYVPAAKESQERSPAYRYSMSNINTVQVNVDANGQNIIGDAANEPSIAVDRNNPNRMAIGWRQFNTISSNFRQAGYGYTTDGGETWTFPGVIEPGFFRSDPVLDADIDGNFYYNSLTNDPTFYCDVFKSSTGGSTWGPGVNAKGGDKQWMTIDKTDGPGSGHIYAYWTDSWSVCYPDFFTRSTNNGQSFEACTSIPNDPYWGTLTVGSGGELYMGGTTGFNFQVAKSTNAQDSTQTVTWSMTTTVNLDGSINYSIGPNPGGLGGQTQIGVDTSGGPFNNYVYLLCSVDRNSNSDPSDVMFARSTNGGLSWSSPVRVNNDLGTSAYQWFGTMSVAPNGRIDAVWLDTRDNPGTYLSALYYSYSTDAGVTWSVNERVSGFFDPHVGWPNQDKMGDYFDMVSDSAGAYLAWAATFNNEQDVYFSRITVDVIPVELVSFTSSVERNVVNLSWSTATELNNRGFEIERSEDKSSWHRIAYVEGKGTTTEPQYYNYSDKWTGESSATLYYRLKQLDYDGSYDYSYVVVAEIAPSEFSLSQNYPNPFNPTTAINYQLPFNSYVTLKVYDVLGNEVATLVNGQKSAGEYQAEFNASGLGSGFYLYVLKAGDPSTGSGQVFVQSRKMLLLK